MKKIRRLSIAPLVAALLLVCGGAARAQDDPKQAQEWFDASAAQAGKPGHFVALAQVEREGKMVADFRYDRLAFDKSPEIERVVTQDGLGFARNAGKGWVASWNWGRAGGAAAAGQSAALDGMVEFALRALQPPADAGAAWKPVKDAPGVFERAAKADAGGDGGAGNPVAVRRCEWSGLNIGLYGYFSGPIRRGFEQVEYTPAKPGQKIKPPAGSQ